MNCEGGRAMIDYNQKSVSGQFIFSAVTPPSSQYQCSASVSSVSQTRPCLGPRPLPNVASLPNLWRAESESDTKYESCMKGWRLQPSAVIQLSATSLISHGLWEVVSDTPHVSLSLDLLIFSSLPEWKLMLTIKHQTLAITEHGTKGHNGRPFYLFRSLFRHMGSWRWQSSFHNHNKQGCIPSPFGVFRNVF